MERPGGDFPGAFSLAARYKHVLMGERSQSVPSA